jgi:hypothetical protein
VSLLATGRPTDHAKSIISAKWSSRPPEYAHDQGDSDVDHKRQPDQRGLNDEHDIKVPA